jgi:hypothetical protein
MGKNGTNSFEFPIPSSVVFGVQLNLQSLHLKHRLKEKNTANPHAGYLQPNSLSGIGPTSRWPDQCISSPEGKFSLLLLNYLFGKDSH